MAGSATIGTNLVDSLLSVVDDLRGSLHPDMGVRQWRVFRRTRTWSGARRGAGTFTDVDFEILPQPLVRVDANSAQTDKLRYELQQAGLNEEGGVALSEISLTYTEDELTGRPIADNAEVFYVLRDAHGQEIRDRYYTLAEPPMPDRVKTIGWLMKLTIADTLDEDC